MFSLREALGSKETHPVSLKPSQIKHPFFCLQGLVLSCCWKESKEKEGKTRGEGEGDLRFPRGLGSILVQPSASRARGRARELFDYREVRRLFLLLTLWEQPEQPWAGAERLRVTIQVGLGGL